MVHDPNYKQNLLYIHPTTTVRKATASITGCLYVLFQKKLLPRSVSRVVSKLFFYPTFPITLLMRIGNYWTALDDTVILGCAPLGILGIPKRLYDLNVRGVINMCNEFSGPENAYERLGIKQLRLPTDDHFEPKVFYHIDYFLHLLEYKFIVTCIYVRTYF